MTRTREAGAFETIRVGLPKAILLKLRAICLRQERSTNYVARKMIESAVQKHGGNNGTENR
jgi:hypothetical protein